MRLHHTPSNLNDAILCKKTDRLLSTASHQLLKLHITNVDRELKIVDAKLSSYKNNLSHLLTPHVNYNRKTHDTRPQQTNLHTK